MDLDCALRCDWMAHEGGLTMGKVKFAVLVKDKNISISTDDTGINILKYLELIAVRVISEMSVEHEKTLRKKLCDMIMSAPTNLDL